MIGDSEAKYDIAVAEVDKTAITPGSGGRLTRARRQGAADLDALDEGGRTFGLPDGTTGTTPSAPAGCNDYEIDEDGKLWVFQSDDEDHCYYTLDPREYL